MCTCRPPVQRPRLKRVLPFDLKKDPIVAAQFELQERVIVAKAFAAKFLAENAATDEEIAAEYEIQAAGAAPPQFKARHILVPTQADAIELIAKLDTGSLCRAQNGL